MNNGSTFISICENQQQGQHLPEHDQNVRDMIHPLIVDEMRFLIGCGHEENPIPTA